MLLLFLMLITLITTLIFSIYSLIYKKKKQTKLESKRNKKSKPRLLMYQVGTPRNAHLNQKVQQTSMLLPLDSGVMADMVKN